MPYPDIPVSVKQNLAAESVREHHHIWHAVRNPGIWNSLDSQTEEALRQAGWKAPRFEQEPGGGIDFLGMHREMISHTNMLFQQADDPAWQSVVGWNPIPFSATDADWPTPDLWPGIGPGIEWAKAPERIPEMQALANQFQSQEYLRARSLERLGTEIEFTIHGWMHLRWSAQPATQPFDVSVQNDDLSQPWSSHVNKHFWKLHGWIDARIAAWEAANNTTADLSGAWSGPTGHLMTFDEAASMRSTSRRTPSTPFRVDQRVVDSVLKGQ